MESLTNYPVILTVIGIVLIGVEIAVFGFGTMFLLFFALACFGTAILQFVGILPESLLFSLLSIAVMSAIFAGLLWKPIKKMQNTHQSKDEQPSSFTGLSFRLASNISASETSEHSYSGVVWQVLLSEELNTEIEAGTTVVVTKAGVGKFYVKPA